jgi:hypothetical protein
MIKPYQLKFNTSVKNEKRGNKTKKRTSTAMEAWLTRTAGTQIGT